MRFSQKSAVKTHKVQHTKERPFACDVCDMTFSYKSAALSHKKTHTNERNFACDECPMKFAYKSVLVTHKMQHSGCRPFKCDECEKGFTRKFYLNSHKLTHRGEKPFPCDECSSRFGTRNLLNQHKRIHAKKSNLPTAPKTGGNKLRVVDKQFPCDECHSKFSSRSELNGHKKSHETLPETVPEVFVETPQSNNVAVLLHKRSVVPGELLVEIVEVPSSEIEQLKTFRPPLPETGFIQYVETPCRVSDQPTYESDLAVGSAIVINDEINSDKILDRPALGDNRETKGRYSSEAVGNQQKFRQHNPVVAVDCANKIIKMPKPYRRPDTSEKRFVCNECPEKFAKASRLKIHSRIHTGANRFVCDECGRGFDRADSFKKHKRWHNGDKRFSCDICGAKFYEKNHLFTHIQRHVGVKNICCNECTSKFVTKSELSQHKEHAHRMRTPVVC